MKISQTIEEEMQRRQLFWYGHLKRMKKNGIPRMAMLYKLTCKKKRGRPRKSWFDVISEAMEKMGIKEECNVDRHRWRKILENRRRRQMVRTADI